MNTLYIERVATVNHRRLSPYCEGRMLSRQRPLQPGPAGPCFGCLSCGLVLIVPEERMLVARHDMPDNDED